MQLVWLLRICVRDCSEKPTVPIFHRYEDLQRKARPPFGAVTPK